MQCTHAVSRCFVLLENVINGFILYKSEDPYELYVLNSACSLLYTEMVVTKYLAVHFMLS